MEPFPFSEDNDKETFRLAEESRKAIEDAQAVATLDYLDGYRAGHKLGYVHGFEDGESAGWVRGREDILHQLKRFAKSNYDPDVQEILQHLTGEDI